MKLDQKQLKKMLQSVLKWAIRMQEDDFVCVGFAKEGYALVRVTNRDGVPYSVIVNDNGFEACSAPTSDEEGLLNFLNELDSLAEKSSKYTRIGE